MQHNDCAFFKAVALNHSFIISKNEEPYFIGARAKAVRKTYIFSLLVKNIEPYRILVFCKGAVIGQRQICRRPHYLV